MIKKSELLEKELKKDIYNLGYDLEYIEIVKEANDKIVRIVIDRLDSEYIGAEDLEKVSKSVEDKVDDLIGSDEKYILEISSAGLERKLKSKELYIKYTGRKVCIKLYKKINDKKEYIGILKEVDDDKIILSTPDLEEDVLEIKFESIACGNTVYDF